MFNRIRWGIAPVPAITNIPRRKPRQPQPLTKRTDFAKALADKSRKSRP